MKAACIQVDHEKLYDFGADATEKELILIYGQGDEKGIFQVSYEPDWHILDGEERHRWPVDTEGRRYSI